MISATNRLITSKDHASVQLNIGHLDADGIYTGQFTTLALCGFVRAQGDADSGVDRLWQKKKFLGLHLEMKKIFGGPGTVCGLLLRIGQCASAAASIGVMLSSTDYLIASMGLQLLWSFGLACLDVYALRGKKDLQNPILVSLFVVGDWVTAMLSLAAACSSAGVVVLFARDLKYCNIREQFSCLRYQVAVALAFVSWFQIAVSSHVTFWILASV
ncbi:hypothetical protein HID58_071156 [Brassica napus]|uniref:CASP-like protein n=1 Tax=Brassica napus TaxID=3708 RepID=A0ABQ7Z0S5_BRANA|nr:hypothetical protein HID58_071156 [Brassica napus]